MKIDRLYGVVLALTLLQFFFWMHQFGPHIPAFYDYSVRILNGHPDWRAVQNRLLAPFILVRLFGWLPAPLPSFVLVFLALCNYLFYRAAREMIGAWGAACALAGYILLWLLLFCKVSQSCDLIEMSVLVLFWQWVMPRSDQRDQSFDVRLVGLFAIQLFNRESALFLPVYMGFCGALRLLWNNNPALGRREMAWGVALFAVGIAVIETLRKTLFVMGPAARAGADLKHKYFENFVIYRLNWMVTRLDLHSHSFLEMVPIFLAMLILLYVVVIFTGILHKNPKLTAFGGTMTLYTTAIFITAELNETRVMQIIVPSAVLTLIWLLNGARKWIVARTAASG